MGDVSGFDKVGCTNGRGPAFTVSFGVASSTDADTFDEIVAIADRALLTAKTDGRNRTVRAMDLNINPPQHESEPTTRSG